MISAIVVMAVTLSIGLTPTADAWWGHDAWEKINVISPSSGSSSNTQTESDCGVTTTVRAGPSMSNTISWSAPQTCDGETFDHGRSMLYINDQYVRYYMFYDDEYNHTWSYGSSNTGDKVEAFNLYYYE